MQNDPHAISNETKKLVESVVREHLRDYDVEPCQIAVIDDDDNSVGISVGIWYRSAGLPISPKKTLALLTDLRSQLVKSGDYRMPFVEHYYAAEQKIEGIRRAC